MLAEAEQRMTAEEEKMKIQVLVCDSVPVVRDGLRSALVSAADMACVAATGSAVEGLMVARELSPDVVITDLNLKGMDGISFVRKLALNETKENPGVVVFTNEMTDLAIRELLRLGVYGLLEKETGKEKLLASIRAAARGELMLAPNVIHRVVGWLKDYDFNQKPEPDPQVKSLTQREREILLLVGEGLSVNEMSVKLFIAVTTVRTHIFRLRHKLNVRDRAQMVSFAHTSGLMRQLTAM
ncbi:response regulator [Actinacidiphila oryziradicis]|uniref:response regulator n=1 Tax=Actinacidiphila oryziradicis TaxID=2571141 RepID=UPI00145D1454|nr:response regulator transcription factor [Actinacidiphila oryziradicis]